MKYIIDMIDDMRENIHNAQDYTLLTVLLKEDENRNFVNSGEKVITSLQVAHDVKQLHLGFLDENISTKELLECVNALDMQAMMYELMVKISDEYPLMNVVGFSENHEQKEYIFFVTT